MYGDVSVMRAASRNVKHYENMSVQYEAISISGK